MSIFPHVSRCIRAFWTEVAGASHKRLGFRARSTDASLPPVSAMPLLTHRARLRLIYLPAFLLISLALAAASSFSPPAIVYAGDTDRDLSARKVGACTDQAGLGMVAASVGLDQVTSGDMTISGIPAGAVIEAAWLYWNGADDGNVVEDDPQLFNPNFHDGDPVVSLNDVQVPRPTRIGGPANWVGVAEVYAYAYRADVKSLVTGNGVYQISGVDSMIGNRGYNNGAELIVLYRVATQPPVMIGLAEGLDLAYGTNGPPAGPGTKAVVFEFASDTVKRTATLSILAGGAGTAGQNAIWYETGNRVLPAGGVRIIGEPQAMEMPDMLTGRNNQNGAGFWDDYTFSVTIPPYTTWLAVQVESKNTTPRAAIDWVGARLQLPLACHPRIFTPLILR